MLIDSEGQRKKRYSLESGESMVRDVLLLGQLAAPYSSRSIRSLCSQTHSHLPELLLNNADVSRLFRSNTEIWETGHPGEKYDPEDIAKLERFH